MPIMLSPENTICRKKYIMSTAAQIVRKLLKERFPNPSLKKLIGYL